MERLNVALKFPALIMDRDYLSYGNWMLMTLAICCWSYMPAYAQLSKSLFFVDMEFADSRHGWIASRYGSVYETTDAGIRWQYAGTTEALTVDLDFINEERGYAVGGSGPTALFRTVNGGQSWSKVLDFSFYCGLNSFARIKADDSNIWLVHNAICIIEPWLAYGAIIVADSSDVGSTWQALFLQQGGLSDLAFGPVSRKWAAGAYYEEIPGQFSWNHYGAIFFDNTAKGDQWVPQYIDQQKDRRLSALSFPESVSGWACGQRGLILHTEDGNIWQEQTTQATSHLYDIDFVTKLVGWAVGDSGTILNTIDGGENWEVQTSGTTACLQVVVAHSADTVIAAGTESTIIHTYDGGKTWLPAIITAVTERNLSDSRRYLLHQNYPNPFNPTTTIEFALPEPATVTLKVYNVLGVEVVTLLSNQALEPGIHRVDFDARGLSGGLYFCRLITPDYQETRKLTLLR